nr:hypothetical protein [Stutzerimonas kirkiae]
MTPADTLATRADGVMLSLLAAGIATDFPALFVDHPHFALAQGPATGGQPFGALRQRQGMVLHRQAGHPGGRFAGAIALREDRLEALPGFADALRRHGRGTVGQPLEAAQVGMGEGRFGQQQVDHGMPL